MRTVFWSVKGGSGVTVTATALALSTPDCLLVDLCGDVNLALGVEEPTVGLAAWLHSPNEVDGSALDRLVVSVRPGLAILPFGPMLSSHCAPYALVAKRFDMLGVYLAARSPSHASLVTKIQKKRTLSNARPKSVRVHEDNRQTVGVGEMQWSNIIVDAGEIARTKKEALDALLAHADRSMLLVKSCFLNVHAAIGSGHRVDGLVVLGDQERRISNDDIAAALGNNVHASIAVLPAVARAVDAGLLGSRLPRSFSRSLGALQPTLDPTTSRLSRVNRLAVAS